MKIPLPQRGQPIDVDYLYQIVKEVNSLNDKISTSSTTLSVINNGIRKDSTVNNLRFYAETKNVKTGAAPSAGTSEQWSFDFSPAFKEVPVVVASVVNNTTSNIGDNIVVTIRTITTSKVTGQVRYNTSGGNVNVNVNIIAIGTT